MDKRNEQLNVLHVSSEHSRRSPNCDTDAPAKSQFKLELVPPIVDDHFDLSMTQYATTQKMPGTVADTSDIVLVSNRLPVQRVKHGRSTRLETSSGGLVSAMRPLLRETQNTWVGWIGDHSTDTAPFENDGVRNWPIPLSTKEVKEFYEGFSNRILWPLYHDAIRAPEYRQTWWETYVSINRRFAQVTAEAAAPDGVVWIHDYHLQLMPTMLRELRPDLRIGFFLHIPFPPQELFSQLPWRCEILEGLLGADVLGFQTKIGAENFIQVAQRFTSATESHGRLLHENHPIQIDSFPISIDFTHFDDLAASDEVAVKAAEIRERLGSNRKILLGLDRLDYTKGIDIRLQAFRQLLQTELASLNDCVLVQIAIPSREHVAEYKELRTTVEQLVGEIEGEFSDIGRNPVHYLHRSVSAVELAALYRAADVMLVTPLRDGMNLVAKEYVASRFDNTGVLVLSEFTGAAKELTSALLVNPHDITALVGRMERALHMPLREQNIRMNSMRKVIKEHDVYHWADSFFQTLAGARV